MTWAWIRPADPSLLEARPLLDLGVGDGQTLRSLGRATGLAVGLDHSASALRAAQRTVDAVLVRGEAERLPFVAASFSCVLAADLFHHLDDHGLAVVLGEVRRILGPTGTCVAWWYEDPGRPGPQAPRFPRPFEHVRDLAVDAGFRAEPLALVPALEPNPPTAGLVARL